MKLITVLMIAACLQVSARGLSQTVTIHEKNIPLEKVFEKIRQQTGYQFFYVDELLRSAAPVTISVRNESLDKVLALCFRDQPLTYTISDKTIIVKRRPAESAAGLPSPAAPADITIKGRVMDDTGTPMEGVSVTIVGSSAGTSTDATGNYSISAPQDATIRFSFIGYKAVEEKVAGRATIDVVLKKNASSIEEVVVIGYGTQRKRDLTGTITSVKGEEIARQPATNPISSLQGRVPGLTIVNNGRAGAAPTVRIRGVNSTNNADPLYVVDGVFQTNIDYLNPGDIEKIEVLRDPSSIAVFGLQGGNGVIIVTTKRAAKGQTRISYQGNVGIQHVTHKISVTDATGFKKLYSAQLANINAAPFDFTNYTANTNWQDLILRDAVINTNTLSISSSGDKSTTLMSLGYNTQQGVLKYDGYQKYITRLNHEIRFSKDIKVGGDLTGFYWNQQNPGADLNNGIWAAPIVPVQQNATTYYSMPTFQRAQVSNPVARLNGGTNNSVNHGYRAVGSLFAEIKLFKYFTWRSAFYTDLGFNSSRAYSPLPFTYIYLGENGAPTTTFYDTSVHTSVSQNQAEYRKYQQDHTLTFDKSFGHHHITALAGFTTLFQGSTTLSGNRKDLTLNIPDDPNYWYLNVVNVNNPVSNDGSGTAESYMSYLGRVNYSFKDKYLINATFRRDGNSKFAARNRWGNFGSIGLGWVISDENFFQSVKKLDFLKLRASWGTVGSGLGFAANSFLPLVTTANSGVFGDNVYTSVGPSIIPDPNLHWESVRGIDLGVEARAFDNRLSTEITLYDRTTRDILTTLTLPGTAGNYSYRTNLGTISNRGIEVSLGWNDKIGKDFSYSVSGNFSYNKNKVVSIGNNIDFEIVGNGGVNLTETGKSIGYFYGYKQVGVYQVTADLDKMPAFSNSLPGDIAYADINHDGVISDKDRTYLGTPFPTWNFGGNVTLGYKHFDLSVDVNGVAGNKIYTQRRNATFATLNYESNRLKAWTGPGTTNVEPILDNTRGNNFLFSSYFLEPGDYLRIRMLQIGYTFSHPFLAKTPVKDLRIYLSGQNLTTFSKVTGYTPEVGIGTPTAAGADNGTFPLPAIYSFGLNVTF
ncbi:MAG TPA: TonB-dependent receptor [Puia sp.]|nr:TonB-dependent receptor [Puia sp.]